MALFDCHFYSDVLGTQTSMLVILPQSDGSLNNEPGQGDRRYPTLYLLHGLSDDHTIWLRRTSIERYVDPLSLAVVMPNVHRSYYTNMAFGYAYWTFVSEELPRLARSFFPLSSAREDNFVAGLSMGGYGAFKLALAHPDRYAAAASLSGVLDLTSRVRGRRRHDRWTEMELIFGDMEELPGSSDDLFHLAEVVARSEGHKPHLYAWCGTEDSLVTENRAFRVHAKNLDLDLMYDEGPGGHDWAAWDQQIQRVLRWLSLQR